MKVFISADIEGVTTTTVVEECRRDNPLYPRHAEQMTKEVLAACAGAFAGGATEILIKDGHGSGTNIDPTQIPEGVTLQRNWTGHPYSMVEGIDSSFDCAMFVGYHAAAGRPGNPLSHTMTGRATWIRLNGQYMSEFMLYSWACALEGVPTVFLSGDKMLCEDSAGLHPCTLMVPVKDGLGNLSRNYSPALTVKQIRETAQRAVSQDLSKAKIRLPEHFEAEVFFSDYAHAEKVSHFPGVKKKDPWTVTFANDSYLEILRTFKWIL